MEFLLTYSMLFCRQLQCLKKHFFDKSFWKGSALQVRCSFQAVKLRYKPLQYSCQKVVCFWQCKLVNNQHSFQKSTNSYCSWKVFFAFKTSFPEVLAPLQKTKNIKQIIRKVLQESWLSLGFNKTLNIPETSRNTLFQKSWDWGSRRSRQKTTFPKVSRFAEKSQNESAFQEVLLLGGAGGGQQRVSEYCFFVSKCFSYFDRCGWPEELSQNIAFLQCGFGSTHSWTNVVWMGFKLWFNVIHIYSLLMFFYACCTWKFKFRCVAFLEICNRNSINHNRIYSLYNWPGSVPKNCTTETALGRTQVTWVHQTNSRDV